MTGASFAWCPCPFDIVPQRLAAGAVLLDSMVFVRCTLLLRQKTWLRQLFAYIILCRNLLQSSACLMGGFEQCKWAPNLTSAGAFVDAGCLVYSHLPRHSPKL